MATRPDAARGKTTRKGKIKKIIKGVMTDFAPGKSIKVKAKGMSPGAMGGRTPKPIRSELEDFFKRSDEVATQLGGIMGTAGSTMKKIKKIKPAGRANRTDEKRAAEMSIGGEVDIDMTTEMDV